MSDTPETIADILRKMRDPDGGQDQLVCFREDGSIDMTLLADRIEAAAERERIELREDEAKMRDALGKLTDAVRNYFGWDDAPAVSGRDDPTAYFCAEMSAALAALATAQEGGAR